MKMKVFIIATIAIFVSLASSKAQTTQSGKKVLIAYYSLRNGNTRAIAEEIQKNVGGKMFRIETVQNYPAQYRAVTEQAKKELESGYRPKLKNTVPDFEQYDVIYLGSPNWWGTIAPAVFTLLESYNFSGKKIIPFITHEGSRMGKSSTDIKKLVPKATVLEGLPVRGGDVKNAGVDVKTWLKKVGQLK